MSKRLVHSRFVTIYCIHPIIVTIEIDDLVQLVEKYRQRTYDEDITYLDEDLGGMKGLA